MSTTRPPRTEAGRQMLALLDKHQTAVTDVIRAFGMVPERVDFGPFILAIEAEAAAPDAGLREALEKIAPCDAMAGSDTCNDIHHEIARAALAAHRSSDPSPALPPCPICGKDDLFIGTDGRPGCPHCEVPVKLGAAPAPDRPSWEQYVGNHVVAAPAGPAGPGSAHEASCGCYCHEEARVYKVGSDDPE